MAAPIITSVDDSRFALDKPMNPGYEPGFSLSDDDKEFLASGGLNRSELMRFLSDMHYEPSWRRQSDTDVEYYDGYQLTPEVLELFAQRGLPPLIINLIQPVINSVLGLEAKSRSDWEVTFDDDASEQVAQALNKKMTEAERESYADRACSEAYGGQVKAGLGWVEVNDQPNPFLFKYRVQSVHRREIWWDWRDTDPFLENARYLIRRKWYDDDMIKAIAPNLEPYLGNRAAPVDSTLAIMDHIARSTDADATLDFPRAISMDMAEWRDSERRRSLMYELWYRVWQKGFIVRLPNDEVCEVDTQNYDQMQMIAAGVVSPVPALWPKMRQSFWIGPHRFWDRWSPLPHQHFPYVPYWGFREDLSSMPYGLIRAMRCPQDEVNARRQRMMTLMSARRVQIDSDALDLTFNKLPDVKGQASAHNHFIVLNPNRLNKAEALKIDSNTDLSVAQLQVLQEAKEEIHLVSGVFTAQQGEGKSGQSGRALDTLVDQGLTTLAEVNDNARMARRRVGELLFSHVKRDSMHCHYVTVGENKNRRQIWLNQKAPGENGQEVIINDVSMSTAKLILQDVPSTAGFRQQQFLMLTEMTKALPPEIQAYVIDFVIEASDRPERKQIAQRIRAAMNLPDPQSGEPNQQPLPPAVQQQIAQGQQMLQEQQQVIQDLSAKLQAATNAMQMENVKHQHKMAEIDAQARLKQTDLAQQQAGKIALATANADAAGSDAQESEGSATDKATEERIMGAIEKIATEVESIKEQVAQPRRSVVTDLGGGKYGVVSVPVQAQAPQAQPAAPAMPPPQQAPIPQQPGAAQ